MVLRIELANLKKVPESWDRSSGIWNFFGFANSNFKYSKRASKISWLFRLGAQTQVLREEKFRNCACPLRVTEKRDFADLKKSQVPEIFRNLAQFSYFRNFTPKFSKRACKESQHFSSWHSQSNPRSVRPPRVETLHIPLEIRGFWQTWKSAIILRTSRILNPE